MKSRLCCALLTMVWAIPAAAQDDRVFLHDGTRLDAVRVDSYDVFSLRYSKGGNHTVAEALYHAIVAADKWRGPEYTLIIGRCRRLLLDEFPSTQWAKLAKDGF